VSNPVHDLSKLRIDRDARPSPGGSRSWKLALAAIAVLAVAAYFGRSLIGGAVPVQVVVVAAADGPTGGPGEGGTAVTANGYVVARTRASVAARIPGRLASLEVSEGSFVRKDAIIARLENADYAAAVEEARADVSTADALRIEAESDRDQANREAARTRRIRAERPDLMSEQELEIVVSRAEQATARANAAVARVTSAQASLRFAEASFQNTVIRAPFTGTVLRKEAELGEVVAPSVGGGLTRGAVVTMADLSTLEVEVDVNEAYIGRVTRGQRARITLDAYPDTGFAGVVRQVVPTADRQRATVQVKVSISDRDPRILPEMGARVDFLLAASVASRTAAAPAADAPARVNFRLPTDAVRVLDGATVVWLVRNGRLESREVEAGPASAGFREIRRGLSGGEQVLIGGLESPVAGQKVQVTP
jgi:HlyD family secretion protein